MCGSGGMLYWYGAHGEVLAESDLSGNITAEYVYFNGKRLARTDNPTDPNTAALRYYISDHLGSTSMVMDEMFTISDPLEDIDYYPYGGIAYQGGSGDLNHFFFTGKERDSETGNDYFGARYYSSNVGRWMSPDPAWFIANEIEGPQSWNLYAYVRNNPLNLTDPTGLDASSNQEEDARRARTDRWDDNYQSQDDALAFVAVRPAPGKKAQDQSRDGGSEPSAGYPMDDFLWDYFLQSTAPPDRNTGRGGEHADKDKAAENKGPQQAQPGKPQQPCYGTNSPLDKAVRFFSLLRLPGTWKELIVGGGVKVLFFESAKAGATSAGGAESMGAAAIETTGKILGAPGAAATFAATAADAKCQIGGSIEPVPH